MLVRERHARELQEGIDFEAVAVVVGDAEQIRVGVEGQQRRAPPCGGARMQGRCGGCNGSQGSSSPRCRPGESRDPYRVIYLLHAGAVPNDES